MKDTSPPDDRRGSTLDTTLHEGSSTARSHGRSTILDVVRQAPIGPLSPLIAGLLTILLFVSTLYVGWMIRESIRTSIRDSLETVLAANVAALELWLADQRDEVEQLADETGVEAAARAILLGGASTAQTDERSVVMPERTERLVSAGYLGWVLLDPLGNVVRCSDQRFENQRFPISREVIRKLESGRGAISMPFEIEGREGPADSSALMCAAVPIHSELKRIGMLALVIDPGRQFTEILTIAQMGDSGETYAFDVDGVLISRSRFETQLRRGGILKPGEASPLKVLIRDPGVDIRTTSVAGANPQTWPMTRMADNATRGGEGVDVIGYRDYRGVEVVGVWRWLPEYDFGVATELDVDEAFEPLAILRQAFFTLFALVTVVGVTLFAIAWITRATEPPENTDDLRRLGHYSLGQRIGRGGMGTVYLGEHGLLHRKVAIKVLENADATDRTLARFRREVQLTAQLQHPNTIEIYDFGRTEDRTFFYVMEFVDGISLEQLVGYYGRQPAERVIYLMSQICGSIAEAHRSGMIHRDIKPANVLLTARSGIFDLVKVLDFGLAKQVDHESMQLTRVDSLTGTPLYMSPESIRDASTADQLSDVYSIGAVGYTLLTGVAPFDGDTSADVCAKKLHQEPPRPDERIGADLVSDLQLVLLDCLSLDRHRRPGSVEELVARLMGCRDSVGWNQHDAALWWSEIFDGPYLDEMDTDDEHSSADGTKGDTAVSDKPRGEKRLSTVA
ncbi:MAG: serine/threonine protein kinase [Planctomycetota bacterium]